MAIEDLATETLPVSEAGVDSEVQRLREGNARPWPGRLWGYARLSGPGWIQGAITLGASTATSAFYLGWKFGYEMLWVNVLGMAMGVVMFASIARPTLFKRESLYRAMGQYIHPAVALTWAVGSILASIFWCLNQYAAATACLADLAQVGGWVQTEAGLLSAKWILGGLILVAVIPLTWTYERDRQGGVRLYESVLKGIVFFMVVCFGLVAFKTGIRWDAVLSGLIPDSFPDNPRDRTIVLGALGCAVGINMTFLYPLTLQARGWTREHLGLARFDLVGGMLLPFAVASSLVIITTANVLQGTPRSPDDPAAVARVMTPLFEGTWLPDATGRVLFDLGIAAMPLSTITILMLISGLAVCEILGKPHRGFWFRVGTLLPSVGILGVAYKAPFWLGPLISSFALILLPVAYLAFLILCNSRRFLGPDLQTGKARLAWNLAMGGVVVIALVGATVKVADLLGSLLAAG